MPLVETTDRTSLAARIASLIRERSWGSLALEVGLIVLGVLLALMIDGAVEERQDRLAEGEYLRLLDRDLVETIQQLDVVQAAAERTVARGLAAYSELSKTISPIDNEVIAQGISALTGRLTVRPFEATYRELLSTGNLRLVADRELRDAIVRYHETAEQNYETFARNRTFFNDEVFAGHIIDEALITPYVREHPVPVVNDVVADLIDRLGPDFEPPRERVLDLGPGMTEWDQLRSRVWVTVVTTQFLAATASDMRGQAAELQERIRAQPRYGS